MKGMLTDCLIKIQTKASFSEIPSMLQTKTKVDFFLNDYY